MRLVFIILAQFFSGSIWFAGNVAFQGQGLLLSAVQAGFIIGTLVFAIFNISDRFSPVKVFFSCSIAGGLFNGLGMFLPGHWLLLASRLCCGICLAGIYPVGMRIAASWYPETISRALGWLVGALVLASGFPYLIKALSWQTGPDIILLTTTILCLSGGVIQLLLVKDGPHLPRGAAFDITVIRKVFSHPGFRAASFGYFGHMWELYAVWAYVPVLINTIDTITPDRLSFLFFATGFAGCGIGGMLALKAGSRTVALSALLVSGMVCLISPAISIMPAPIAVGVLMAWGLAVVTDSPQFSAMNTRFAPDAYVGTALTIVNCIGFLITIASIELTGLWIDTFGIQTAFLPLAAGPVFGMIFLLKERSSEETG